jgi:hypothetical protein
VSDRHRQSGHQDHEPRASEEYRLTEGQFANSFFLSGKGIDQIDQRLSAEADAFDRTHHCFLTPHAVTIAFNSLTRSSSTS